jgi:hypothetical protein
VRLSTFTSSLRQCRVVRKAYACEWLGCGFGFAQGKPLIYGDSTAAYRACNPASGSGSDLNRDQQHVLYEQHKNAT